MRTIKFFILSALLCELLSTQQAYGAEIENNFGGNLHGLAGYSFADHQKTEMTHQYHLPAYASAWFDSGYLYDDGSKISINGKIMAQSGTYLQNLNQGAWGEEFYGLIATRLGDFYGGQMPNVGTILAVDRPNLPTWQANTVDWANFIYNPNWFHKKSHKSYNSLTSTTPDADGSSFKLAYLSPEIAGTVLGVSFTPDNNARDNQSSKFSDYHHEGAYTLALYHTHNFADWQTETSLSFADYERSHYEYAGGLSVYRKGWTVFASYRQTEVSGSDKPIRSLNDPTKHPHYDDGWRQSRAWKAGVAYEWALFNYVFSYFDSKARDSQARNQIWDAQVSARLNENLTLYTGLGYLDFKSANRQLHKDVKGMAIFSGLEFNFRK